jgi:hypothetical protein
LKQAVVEFRRRLWGAPAYADDVLSHRGHARRTGHHTHTRWGCPEGRGRLALHEIRARAWGPRWGGAVAGQHVLTLRGAARVHHTSQSTGIYRLAAWAGQIDRRTYTGGKMGPVLGRVRPVASGLVGGDYWLAVVVGVVWDIRDMHGVARRAVRASEHHVLLVLGIGCCR